MRPVRLEPAAPWSRVKDSATALPLINVKMPTIVGILTLMSKINFMFSRVEHEKKFITSRPVLTGKLKTKGFFMHRCPSQRWINM